jgi:hypothetical protein
VAIRSRPRCPPRSARLRASRAVAAIFCLTLPTLVWAHGDASAPATVAVTLDEPAKQLAGLKIQLQRTLANQLVVENRTSKRLEVYDQDGTPFLRIGPRDVEANLSASAWYRSLAAGDARVPVGLEARAPRWVRVSATPSWGWFDPRLSPEAIHVPDEVAESGQQKRIGTWTIPLRFGAAAVRLSGGFRFEPLPSGVFRSRITSPTLIAPGVRITLVPGRVPALYLENLGDAAVTILGSRNEPFLRLDQSGTEANLRSPTWRQSGRAEVVTEELVAADPSAPPLWKRQSPAPRYAWIEPRAAYLEREPPEPIRERGRPAEVLSWQIPIVCGGRRATITGVTEWTPAGAIRKPAPAEPVSQASAASRSEP